MMIFAKMFQVPLTKVLNLKFNLGGSPKIAIIIVTLGAVAEKRKSKKISKRCKNRVSRRDLGIDE